jgi:hypothetical protein
MLSDDRQYAPATLRNRDFILDVLRDVLPTTGVMLEVASESGEHIVNFAMNFRRSFLWVRQACCPAASRISRVISSGWEISERWLAFTSMVLAPIRLAMKRSRSGLIVRSSVETA